LDYVCPAPEPLGENQIILVESILSIMYKRVPQVS
jgi:hypothetical protein